MINRTVKSMGFEILVPVPATVDEYNALAPKRENPVLEDAVLNVLYRGVLNKFRDGLLEALEKVTGIARINAGTKEEPVWEKDTTFFKRVIVEVAKQRGLDPAADATVSTLMSEWKPIAQSVVTGGSISYTNEKGESVTETLKGIKFDPSERESTGGGNLIAKKYTEWASEAVKKGTHTRMAELLAKALNREVSLVGDTDKGDESQDIKTLARAISDREKQKREEQDRASKAELGL